jgi:hypothetical protein
VRHRLARVFIQNRKVHTTSTPLQAIDNGTQDFLPP